MVIVSGEIVFVYEQVVVSIQLPELTIDDVEMFITEKKKIHLFIGTVIKPLITQLIIL